MHPSRKGQDGKGVTGSPDLGKVTECQPKERGGSPRTNTRVSSRPGDSGQGKARHLRALTQGRAARNRW